MEIASWDAYDFTNALMNEMVFFFLRFTWSI